MKQILKTMWNICGSEIICKGAQRINIMNNVHFTQTWRRLQQRAVFGILIFIDATSLSVFSGLWFIYIADKSLSSYVVLHILGPTAYQTNSSKLH